MGILSKKTPKTPPDPGTHPDTHTNPHALITS